jgi:hypothetical protein
MSVGVYRRRPSVVPYQRRRLVPKVSTGTTYTGPPAGTGRVEVCGNAVVTYSATPANTVAPAVTGTKQRLQTLTTDNGTWINSPSSYTYQWQRDNSGGLSYSNIGGATASTRVLDQSDVGCNVRCVVTATNATGSTSANSNASLIGDYFAGPVAATGHVDVNGTAAFTYDAPAGLSGGGSPAAGFLLLRRRKTETRRVADKPKLLNPH